MEAIPALNVPFGFFLAPYGVSGKIGNHTEHFGRSDMDVDVRGKQDDVLRLHAIGDGRARDIGLDADELMG